MEPLIQLLAEGEFDARCFAAWALGKQRDARGVEPLIRALDDESRKVRDRVVTALVELEDARAVEPFVERLVAARCKRDYRWTFDELVMALAAFDGASTNALERLLERDAFSCTGVAAAEALVRLGQPQAQRVLLDGLESDDAAVCKAALASLQRIGDQRATRPLIGLLSHSDPSIRGSAAHVLGSLGQREAAGPEAVEPLLDRALNDPYFVEETQRARIYDIANQPTHRWSERTVTRYPVRAAAEGALSDLLGVHEADRRIEEARLDS